MYPSGRGCWTREWSSGPEYLPYQGLEDTYKLKSRRDHKEDEGTVNTDLLDCFILIRGL